MELFSIRIQRTFQLVSTPDRCNYRKSEIAIPVHPRKRWSDKGYADDELHSVWRHGRTCSVCPSAPMSGFGHAACRNGRKRTPGRDSPCAKVQAQESENPFTHVRDCRGKPDPKGNAQTTARKNCFWAYLEKRKTEYSEVSPLWYIFVIERR